jgi:excinuclease ABC subunit A
MSEPLSTTADPQSPAEAGVIRIRGARVHNLKNIDVDIPRQRLVVLTGPSGSGKSSLAFDTLFAEGQRQYIETLSTYARQFLNQLERPDVDLIEGLQPTICIDQRPISHNPRSTVATVTEIYDYLRLLMARVGETSCWQCQAEIRQLDPEEILDRLLALPDGTKAILLAPLVRGRRGQHREVLQQIRQAGFNRARVNGQVFEVESLPELAPRKAHDIEAVVDRIILRPGVRNRLAESLQLALRHGDGVLIVCRQQKVSTGGNGSENGWHDELFSTRYACPQCGISYEEIEPRTFSFNSPYGACPECSGLGVKCEFDPELVLPDLNLSLDQGALAPYRGLRATQWRKWGEQLEQFTESKGLDWSEPLKDWKAGAVEKLLRGEGKKFGGVLLLLEKEYATATRADRKEQLERFRGDVVCSACQGSRLRPEANSVRLGGKTMLDITRMSVVDVAQFFADLEVDESIQPIAQPLIQEIRNRLSFLSKVGLDYLTLNRSADTLSGGELQRVRLASAIGSALIGVCYVLDEPSIGLHSRDNDRLIAALRELQRQGNTVLVVEHDEAMIRAADLIIDIGPRAGGEGGRIVALGTPEEVVAADHQSLTGGYLRGELTIPIPATRRSCAKSRSLVIEGVTANNLKNVDVAVPLQAFVCITGVSGSGKSSLINETLARALARKLGMTAPRPGPHRSLRGASQIDRMIEIDQSPIGRTPRSNPATYIGVFDEIRKVFAASRDAKQRGFRASRFSFNVKGGRCEGCQGQGVRKIEMNFLPDLYVVCGDCDGARFNAQTLAVRYRDKNIADVLAMSVDEAVGFFENFDQIHRALRCMQEVGLGYIYLGQPSNTLSGGEAQRVKLAAQLARQDTGRTLYLLDEPTTGLHFDDIRRLMDVLQQLVDRGNTVVVIEHHLDVIKCADWIIDLGPEGGAAGGHVVAAGPPEQIVECAASYTGQFLKRHLESFGASARNAAEDP